MRSSCFILGNSSYDEEQGASGACTNYAFPSHGYADSHREHHGIQRFDLDVGGLFARCLWSCSWLQQSQDGGRSRLDADIQTELEDQIVAGDGLEKNFAGLLNVAGTQTAAR
jgi:hypothetical protein